LKRRRLALLEWETKFQSKEKNSFFTFTLN
jgi:hypothetical protein